MSSPDGPGGNLIFTESHKENGNLAELKENYSRDYESHKENGNTSVVTISAIATLNLIRRTAILVLKLVAMATIGLGRIS